jgi:uncharacterized protein
VKIAGSYTIDAPREAVWSALNDIEVLARTIPGCQRLEQIGENTFETTLKVGLQAVKGVYQGKVELGDVQPPHHYTVAVDGKGSNGFLKGRGAIDLEEQPDGKTTLRYGGDANIGGALATVGQRLIDGAAKTLISQSLKALEAQIKQRQDALSAPPVESPVAEEAAEATEQGVSVGEVFAQPAAQETGASDAEARAEASAAAAKPAAASSPTIAAKAQPSPVPSEAASATRNGVAVGAVFAEPAADELAASPVHAQHRAAQASSAPSFERRSVVVPEHEQLKPESVLWGAALDIYREQPWIPWVVVAFLLGLLVGRRR